MWHTSSGIAVLLVSTGWIANRLCESCDRFCLDTHIDGLNWNQAVVALKNQAAVISSYYPPHPTDTFSLIYHNTVLCCKRHIVHRLAKPSPAWSENSQKMFFWTALSIPSLFHNCGDIYIFCLTLWIIIALSDIDIAVTRGPATHIHTHAHTHVCVCV